MKVFTNYRIKHLERISLLRGGNRRLTGCFFEVSIPFTTFLFNIKLCGIFCSIGVRTLALIVGDPETSSG